MTKTLAQAGGKARQSGATGRRQWGADPDDPRSGRQTGTGRRCQVHQDEKVQCHRAWKLLTEVRKGQWWPAGACEKRLAKPEPPPQLYGMFTRVSTRGGSGLDLSLGIRRIHLVYVDREPGALVRGRALGGGTAACATTGVLVPLALPGSMRK